MNRMSQGHGGQTALKSQRNISAWSACPTGIACFGVEEQDRQVMPPTDGHVYGGAQGMLSSLFMVSHRRSRISMA